MSLEIRNGKAFDLPSAIANKDTVRSLSLYGHQLTEIPKEILDFKSLEILSLEANKLTVLPAWLAQTNLKEIHVSNNEVHIIEKLPSTLNVLQLEKNKLDKFPLVIQECPNLHTLNLKGNLLTEIPDFFSSYLKKLKVLLLSENSITQLPLSLYTFDGEITLEEIDILGLPFEEIPFAIFLSPHYENVTTSEYYKNKELQKARMKFVKACYKKQTDLEIIKDFCHLVLEKEDDIETTSFDAYLKAFSIEYYTSIKENREKISLENCFKALAINYQPLQTNALKIIRNNWEEKLKEKPLQKGTSITILGKTGFNKKELKTRLAEIEIELTTKITIETTHVVVENGVTKYEGIDQEGLIFIPENALQQKLNETESLHFQTENVSNEDIENIQALLSSPEPDNVNVGLEMLKSLGVPKEVITELVLVMKNTVFSTSIRNKAKDIVLTHGSQQLKINLQNSAKFSLSGIAKKLKTSSASVLQGIANDIETLTKNSELDVLKICTTLVLDYGIAFRYLFKVISTDQERIILLEKILEEDPDFEITPSFFIDIKNTFTLNPNLVKVLTLSNDGNVYHPNFMLDNLPLELFRYTELEELNLNNMKISFLPNEFEKLTKLNYLNLCHTKFEEFPTVLINMKTLNRIRFDSHSFLKDSSKSPDENIFKVSQIGVSYTVIRK